MHDEQRTEIARLRAEIADLKDRQLPARVNAAAAPLHNEVARLRGIIDRMVTETARWSVAASEELERIAGAQQDGE